MTRFLFTKFRNIVLSRLYTNTKVIVYAYSNKPTQSIPLELRKVDGQNFSDARVFEDTLSFRANEKNMANGDTGYYGYYQDKCVFRGWVTPGPKKVLLHKFCSYSLMANEVYIHGCLTDPKHRGKGFYPFAISEIAELYKQEGKRTLISTNYKNTSSIKGITRAGFKQISEIDIKMIAGFKKVITHESE